MVSRSSQGRSRRVDRSESAFAAPANPRLQADRPAERSQPPRRRCLLRHADRLGVGAAAESLSVSWSSYRLCLLLFALAFATVGLVSGCAGTEWVEVRRHFYHSGPPGLAGRYSVTLGEFVAGASREVGFVFGRVIDTESGEYVLDAEVSAADQTTSTDSLGRFALTLPRGRHALRVEPDGYEPMETQPLNVGGRAVEVTFAVRFAQLYE